MAPSIDHNSAWRLARGRFGVITRPELLALGFSADAIKHRIRKGRLRVLWPGIYLVGQLEPSREALFMGAVLACGDDAMLSHTSAAALWGIHPSRSSRRAPQAGLDPIHVTVPASRRIRLDGIKPHRRRQLPPATTIGPIPLGSPLSTLADLATMLGDRALEAAVNEADKLGLIDPRKIRSELPELPRTKRIARLERILGAHTRTDSGLERAFLRLARRAGLPPPQTQRRVNGHRVDFHWPQYDLVVETDGGAYHRTPTQQLRDRRRDHAHAKAGLTPLRFAELQIVDHPDEVVATLRALTVEQRQ